MPKFVPDPTPETQPFWDSCAQGRLSIQFCSACEQHFFPPRSFCPSCWGDVEWTEVTGNATLHSYVISHRPAPGFEDDGPYAIAIVELAEGPRMMCNIVGIPSTPDALELDMPLSVMFEERGDLTVPQFGPAQLTR